MTSYIVLRQVKVEFWCETCRCDTLAQYWVQRFNIKAAHFGARGSRLDRVAHRRSFEFDFLNGGKSYEMSEISIGKSCKQAKKQQPQVSWPHSRCLLPRLSSNWGWGFLWTFFKDAYAFNSDWLRTLDRTEQNKWREMRKQVDDINMKKMK